MKPECPASGQFNYWSALVAPVMKDEPMNAVVSRPEQPVEGGALLEIISRAASDPNVDVDKMQRLLEMHKSMQDRQALAAFNSDFAQMQSEMPVITERGEIKVNNQVRSRYATFEDINEAVKPVLQKYGFAINFRTKTEANAITATGVLMHRLGHREQTDMVLPADTSGGKNNVQAIGSSVAYAKRYVMCALLNITSRGEDDDGRKAGNETLSNEQIANIEALLTEVGSDKGKFLKWAKVNSLEEILAKNYKAVIQALEDKRKR